MKHKNVSRFDHIINPHVRRCEKAEMQSKNSFYLKVEAPKTE